MAATDPSPLDVRSPAAAPLLPLPLPLPPQPCSTCLASTLASRRALPRLLHPASCILHPASCILHPAPAPQALHAACYQPYSGRPPRSLLLPLQKDDDHVFSAVADTDCLLYSWRLDELSHMATSLAPAGERCAAGWGGWWWGAEPPWHRGCMQLRCSGPLAGFARGRCTSILQLEPSWLRPLPRALPTRSPPPPTHTPSLPPTTLRSRQLLAQLCALPIRPALEPAQAPHP